MRTVNWQDCVSHQARLLEALSIRDEHGLELTPDAGFARLRELTCSLRARRGTIFLVGNGASASMASHVAADLAKNCHVRTELFFDLALITAMANDISYAEVFAEPLRRRLNEGDMLVAISSSGASPNVLAAAREARRLGGSVATFSAMRPDNPLRGLGHINLHVAAETYGGAESCHAFMLHYWIDLMTDGHAPAEAREKAAPSAQGGPSRA